jgi:hypothetical protein
MPEERGEIQCKYPRKLQFSRGKLEENWSRCRGKLEVIADTFSE